MSDEARKELIRRGVLEDEPPPPEPPEDEGDDGDDDKPEPAGNCELEYEEVDERRGPFSIHRRSMVKKWRTVHAWTKWQHTDIKIVGVETPYSITGQERQCLRCGFRELKRL